MKIGPFAFILGEKAGAYNILATFEKQFEKSPKCNAEETAGNAHYCSNLKQESSLNQNLWFLNNTSYVVLESKHGF